MRRQGGHSTAVGNRVSGHSLTLRLPTVTEHVVSTALQLLLKFARGAVVLSVVEGIRGGEGRRPTRGHYLNGFAVTTVLVHRLGGVEPGLSWCTQCAAQHSLMS